MALFETAQLAAAQLRRRRLAGRLSPAISVSVAGPNLWTAAAMTSNCSITVRSPDSTIRASFLQDHPTGVGAKKLLYAIQGCGFDRTLLSRCRTHHFDQMLMIHRESSMASRNFRFREGKSDKFWDIELHGESFTIKWGRTGTEGQSQVKEFASEAEAKKAHDKLVAEKIKKGYVETDAAPSPLALLQEREGRTQQEGRKTVKDAWARIQAWCAKNAPDVKLSPGCSANELDSLEASLGVNLPEDFRESYLIHHGDNGTCCFYYSMFLLSLEGVAREWQRMCDLFRVNAVDEEEEEVPVDGAVKRLDWNAKWIPFSSNDSGEYIFLDMDPGTLGTLGQVVDFSHEEGPVRLMGKSFEAFLVDYADGLEAGIFTFDSSDGWIRALNEREFQAMGRLTWKQRKTAAAGKTRSTKKGDKRTVDRQFDTEAVAFLNRFLLELRQWKTGFWVAKRKEIDQGKIDNDAGRQMIFDELRSIYRKHCRYSKTFPFGEITDAPFTVPEGSTILSVTEQGDETTVVFQVPKVTHEKLRYAIIQSTDGLKVASREIVEDTQNVEVISFMMHFLDAMRELVVGEAHMHELAKGGKLDWDEMFKQSKVKIDAFHAKFCPPSDKPRPHQGVSLFHGAELNQYKFLSIAEKGKKIVVVYHEEPQGRAFDKATQQWTLTKEEWLNQDPARIDDLYTAGGFMRTVFQCTLMRTDEGLKVSDKIKMYMEVENRFVNYFMI
jgi:cell wall assembly regulator SMI1/predicted DNA-binding WGR domain protein